VLISAFPKGRPDRVSTKRHGESGLGLEAQRAAVADYLSGGRWTPVRESVEVESGKRDDRPELQKALEACKAFGATLVIAKLIGSPATRTSCSASRRRA
jgi:DNA invertase Pin-like site-specific DNA recombinase